MFHVEQYKRNKELEKEKKYFADPQSGILNSDDVDAVVGANSWVNAENVRTGTTDAGVTGTVESVGSTVLKSTPQPSVTNLCIGSVADEENGRIVYFYKNLTGVFDKIVCYYATTETEYTVLRAEDVVGYLNFSKDSLIHSAKIVNGYLYFPDGTNNEPRKINIEAGIKAYDPTFDTSAVAYNLPIAQDEITLIKKPPCYCPSIQKQTDGGFSNNFIANDSFEFAFQYTWYDNETTVVGAYSQASRLNSPNDTYNYIEVSMNPFEVIPDTVRFINLIVRIGNSNIAKTIKVWDKEVTADNTEIESQNSGAQVLTFDFYNNTTGAFLAVDDVLRPFDNVPIYSEAMEAARNRLFLANNTEGYDTPGTTSMAIALGSAVTLAATSVSTLLITLKHRSTAPFGGGTLNGNYAYSAWYVYLQFLPQPGYYAITSTEQSTTGILFQTYPTLPAAPTSVAISGLTFRGATLAQVYANTKPADTAPTSQTSTATTALSCTITGTGQEVYSVYAQKSPYRTGVVFYDYAMRKCGVVTNDDLLISTPARNYAYTTGIPSINWTLSNAAATTEIPDWAYYYAPVRTLNQRTRFFIQSFTDSAKYATKNSDGNYVFSSNLFPINCVGIGLNTAALIVSGLGYVFTEGDVCILVKDDNTVYEIPVIGQDGNYIILKSQDVGDLSGKSFVYEIYSPYQPSEQEPFFEIGQMYQVLNQGTSDRQYSVTFGSFPADSYALIRNFNNSTYFAGAMCPNDLYYQRWDNDGGKVNIVTKLGQVVKKTFISFSDVFLPNTSVNGLSTFRALNESRVSEDCGEITKLQITSKVQSEGTVMLAICANETNSLYLGETQILDNTGATQFFAQSTGVIGTINILKGSFGCVNPESVVEFRGNVYWYDRYNGKIIQYTLNGLFPISNYKMTRFWRQFSNLYSSLIDCDQNSYGKIYINDLGLPRDSIEVFVDDPFLGSISLGSYEQVSGDTTTTLFATHLATALAANTYGYTISSSLNCVTITARSGLGNSINIGNRLSVVITPYVGYRITENSNQRITEGGDNRIIE